MNGYKSRSNAFICDFLKLVNTKRMEQVSQKVVFDTDGNVNKGINDKNYGTFSLIVWVLALTTDNDDGILWLALIVQKSGIQELMKNNNGGISDLALIVQKWAKTFTSNVLIILMYCYCYCYCMFVIVIAFLLYWQSNRYYYCYYYIVVNNMLLLVKILTILIIKVTDWVHIGPGQGQIIFEIIIFWSKLCQNWAFTFQNFWISNFHFYNGIAA